MSAPIPIYRSRTKGPACEAATRVVPLSNGQMLLVQQVAGRAPHFHSPIAARVDRLPAERAIPFVGTGSNRQLPRPPQRLSSIPAVDECRVAQRLDACIEDDRPGRDGLAGRIA